MTDRRGLGEFAGCLVFWALVSLMLVVSLKAQPASPPVRSTEVEVLQASRAYAEQQLANMLEQARALQKQVDDLKQQLAACKETP